MSNVYGNPQCDEYSYYSDPRCFLDAKIHELSSSLPALIEHAEEHQEAHHKFEAFTKNSRCYPVILASWKHMYGHFVQHKRKIKHYYEIYDYAHTFFHGLGEGLPYCVKQPTHVCTPFNFEEALEQYQLTGGVYELLSTYGVKVTKSLIREFYSYALLKLACVFGKIKEKGVKFGHEKKKPKPLAAAKVLWNLDNLKEAYFSRLNLESSSI